MAIDPKWEFNCPQYVDFNEPLQCDEAIDSFFDSHNEASADPKDISFTKESAALKTIDRVEEKNIQMPDKKGTNASRCLQVLNDTLKKLYPLRATPSRLEREAAEAQKRKRMHVSTNSVTADPSAVSGNCNEKNKNCSKEIIHSSTEKSHNIPPLKLSMQDRRIISKKKFRTHQNMRKTMAKFSKRFLKTSEEIELDKIKELRKELVAHRTLSMQSMKKALRSHTSSQNSSTASRQYTVVKPFKFATDSRIKNTVERDNRQEKDFVSSLRSNSLQQQQDHSADKVTKPVPFKFSQSRKRKHEEGIELYHPLAEQVEAFQQGKDLCVGNKKHKEFENTLTTPRTPNLQAITRHRPVNALSQEEKEELIVQEMQSYRFKANAINAGIMGKPKVLKPVEPKSLTKPEDVHLETEKRYMLRQRAVCKEEEKFEFHANPAPKKIFEKVVGLREKVEVPCTDPKSPAFALKQRAQMWKERDEKQRDPETPIPVFKATPLPYTGIQFWPKHEKKVTVPEPFSFEEYDNERRFRKEKKIQEEIQKQSKVPEFKARPIITPSKVNLPVVPKMPLTQIQPFNLLIEQRCNEKQEKWKKEIEEELIRQKNATVFKAGPNKVIYEKPFVPSGASRPPSDAAPFVLHTERRAEERENFDFQRFIRQKELEEERERQLKEQKEKEEAEIARLRMEAVHKALPVKHYRSKPIQPSNVELTQPQSPFLHTRLRSRERQNVTMKSF